MNRIPPPIPARTWRQHLQWAEDYFLFPAGGGGGGRGAESSSSSLLSPSRLAVSPAVAFRFAGTGRTLVVRNKSGATYTGPSLRALLIRITDSGALDDHSDDDEEEEEHWDGEKQSHGGYDGYRRRRRGLQRRMLPAELDMGTCILRFWEDRELVRQWPNWEQETAQIQCSSKWYSKVLGWTDQKIKMEFGLASMMGPDLTYGTPI